MMAWTKFLFCFNCFPLVVDIVTQYYIHCFLGTFHNKWLTPEKYFLMMTKLRVLVWARSGSIASHNYSIITLATELLIVTGNKLLSRWKKSSKDYYLETDICKEEYLFLVTSPFQSLCKIQYFSPDFLVRKHILQNILQIR